MRVYIIFGEIYNLTWLIFILFGKSLCYWANLYAIGQFFSVVNGLILKKANWSLCYLDQSAKMCLLILKIELPKHKIAIIINL